MITPFRSPTASRGFWLCVMLAPLFFAGCGEKPKPAGKGGGGAAPVLVGKVQRKVAPLTINAIGAVEPIRTTGVRAQVTGTLQKIDFKEGQEVKEGDLLFEIDPRPFENALRSAQADQQKAKVQLDNEVAEVERYKGLSEQGMVSKEQYLAIQTTERTARAALASADAAVANDQLSLDYCSVRAPFSGLTGSLGVHEGDLVRASDANIAMITINQISPVYVTFSVPQDNLGSIARYRAAGSLDVKATPPGQAQKPETGTLSFIDNNIDSTTGTLKLKASFPNDDHRLWPGQFADVRLTLDSPEAIVVPTVAVQNDQTGQHVFVVKEDNTAEFRTIVVDRAVDMDSVVSKGLKVGETVITEGQIRVLPGKPVQIKKTATPDMGDPGLTPAGEGPAAEDKANAGDKLTAPKKSKSKDGAKKDGTS